MGETDIHECVLCHQEKNVEELLINLRYGLGTWKSKINKFDTYGRASGCSKSELSDWLQQTVVGMCSRAPSLK